jgi:CarD family transcriptional regulator
LPVGLRRALTIVPIRSSDEGVVIAEEPTKFRGMSVGDTVVYAAHGIGRIVARERKQIGGTERDCVIVDLAAGLRVTLQLDDAAERLRAVVGEKELDAVRSTLASAPAAREEPWTKRMKTIKAKLAAGRATDLAEIVRDGERLERAAGGTRLSHGESHVYRRARALLVGEVCSARGVGEDEAEAWIEAQIALANGSGD